MLTSNINKQVSFKIYQKFLKSNHEYDIKLSFLGSIGILLTYDLNFNEKNKLKRSLDVVRYNLKTNSESKLINFF